MTAEAGLFRKLFDDASLFPPASLSLRDALAAHVRHQAAWYGPMSGPFVCADARLTQLSAALTVAGIVQLDVALVVPGGASTLDDAVDAVAADPRLRLRGVEVPIDRASDAQPGAAVKALTAALDRTPLAAASAFVEIPCGTLDHEAIQDVSAHRYLVKLRTGGTTAEAFPDEATLARCLVALADYRLAFKCTAGLHHAIRHRADDTGFEHHGFLNVLLAVAAALDGATEEEVAAILSNHDGDLIAAAIRGLSADACAEARSLFTSFGTCSTDEPISDLVTLGLISAD